MAYKKILIIHLSRLGDMIQSLPAVKSLKEDYPESEITYFGIEDFCIPLKGVPWIDNLATISLHDIEGILKEAVDVTTEAFDRLFQNNPALNAHYDVLINMTHSGGSGYLCERIKSSEKRGRVFSKADEVTVAGNWGKYLFAVARNRNNNLLNLVDLYTGMMGVRNRPVRDYLPTNPERDRLCLSHLMEHGYKPEGLAVGFQLGASNSLRTWPPEYFFRLGKLMRGELDAQIILFGSEREQTLAEQFHKSAPFPFIDLIGKTTLAELPSFLKYINVLVSNDTGPMHIAAAVGTKVVGIFAGTAYFRITGPYGSGHVAVQSNHPCAPCLKSNTCLQPLCRESIAPETVLQAVQLAMGIEGESINRENGASLYISEFNKNGTLFYKRVDDKKQGFPSWLRSYHDIKAFVSQTLWNEWLGIEPAANDVHISGDDDELLEILRDYKNACLSYRSLYMQEETACKKIIDEFHKTRPSLKSIQDDIARIEHIEQEIKNMEGPLAIAKEIHELYSAEVEYCNFPKLAHEFINKSNQLDKIILGFEDRLNQISHRLGK